MAKILLVEDDQNLSSLIQNVLEAEGYLVMTANSGKMALEWVDNSKPDLVILDIGLPDISGIEVCKKIKGSNVSRRIPTIILTATMDNQTKMQANLDAHADLFLNKPIANKDLISAIKILLEKASADNTLRRTLFRRNKTL